MEILESRKKVNTGVVIKVCSVMYWFLWQHLCSRQQLWSLPHWPKYYGPECNWGKAKHKLQWKLCNAVWHGGMVINYTVASDTETCQHTSLELEQHPIELWWPIASQDTECDQRATLIKSNKIPMLRLQQFPSWNWSWTERHDHDIYFHWQRVFYSYL